MADELWMEDENEYYSSDEIIGPNDDPDQEYANPFTGAKFRIEDYKKNPPYPEFLPSIGSCSDPGHDCRKNYEEFQRMYGSLTHVIPDEKLPLKFVYREAWGASPPTAPPEVPILPVINVVFYFNTGAEPCTSEEECKRTVREMQRVHMEEWGLPDIGFNFLVGGNGDIYTGRGWHAQPDKTFKYPFYRHRRLDIGFLAPLDEESKEPDQDVIERALQLVYIGMLKDFIRTDHELYENSDHPQKSIYFPKNST